MVTSEAAPQRWGLRDRLAAAALFAATAAVILWQNAHIAVLWDLSYVLDTSARIASGQLPYRDFPLVHSPLTFVVQAAIMRLTGRVLWHHTLYVAAIGGLSTLLTWRMALRVTRDWWVALMLASPLAVLGIYCILPHPSYDCECAFWMLVALWFLLRLEDAGAGWGRGFAAGAAACVPAFFKQNMGLPFLAAVLGCAVMVLALRIFRRNPTPGTPAPEVQRSLDTPAPAAQRSPDTSTPEAQHSPDTPAPEAQPSPDTLAPKAQRSLAPRFSVGNPRSTNSDESRRYDAALWGVLAGAATTLAAAVLTLHFTAGIGNYLHWTVRFAGQRRMPTAGAMLSVYAEPQLLWMLPCLAVGWWLTVRSSALSHPNVETPQKRNFDIRMGHPQSGAWIRHRAMAGAALLLISAPFLWTLSSLLCFEDRDDRAAAFLAVWPLLLIAAWALAIWRVIRLRSALRVRDLLPLILLAGISGTFMSQQLWGSTYAIWPLLVLLIAEWMTAPHAVQWVKSATAAVIAVTLLACGTAYLVSEERLEYAQFPAGPAVPSATPQLKGLASPGPFVPELDEMLQYAAEKIPRGDGVVLIPGEDPFYFVTGRVPQFPVLLFDPTTDPYSPEQTAAEMRARGIRWLIVKRNLQMVGNPAPEPVALMLALEKEFVLVAQLRGYDVYEAGNKVTEGTRKLPLATKTK
jgi:hypothetical protein